MPIAIDLLEGSLYPSINEIRKIECLSVDEIFANAPIQRQSSSTSTLRRQLSRRQDSFVTVVPQLQHEEQHYHPYYSNNSRSNSHTEDEEATRATASNVYLSQQDFENPLSISSIYQGVAAAAVAAQYEKQHLLSSSSSRQSQRQQSQHGVIEEQEQQSRQDPSLSPRNLQRAGKERHEEISRQDDQPQYPRRQDSRDPAINQYNFHYQSPSHSYQQQQQQHQQQHYYQHHHQQQESFTTTSSTPADYDYQNYHSSSYDNHHTHSSSSNHHHHSHDYHSMPRPLNSNTLLQEQAPKEPQGMAATSTALTTRQVEIAPGQFMSLRSTKEAKELMAHGYYTDNQCPQCQTTSRCLLDVAMVLCPACRGIYPNINNSHTGGLHGLGIGVRVIHNDDQQQQSFSPSPQRRRRPRGHYRNRSNERFQLQPLQEQQQSTQQQYYHHYQYQQQGAVR